uniref:Uncharacterized protein n=1 Tax=Arundo donax TaxID=35708 RepID=A0A0A9FN17_ARUDO
MQKISHQLNIHRSLTLSPVAKRFNFIPYIRFSVSQIR